MFYQFGRRNQTMFMSDLPDSASDNPKRQCHKACTKSHDREKGIAVPVAGAGGSEDGKRGKIGGHHGSQQNQRAQLPVCQKISIGRRFPACAGNEPDGQND